MAGWVGHVGWLVADALPTKWFSFSFSQVAESELLWDIGAGLMPSRWLNYQHPSTQVTDKYQTSEQTGHTRTVRIAATISTRLLGRGTSMLPMYYKQTKKVQQSWQTSALAMHLPLARLVSMPVIFYLHPSSSTVILVLYLFSTGISEQHVWELWV